MTNRRCTTKCYSQRSPLRVRWLCSPLCIVCAGHPKCSHSCNHIGQYMAADGTHLRLLSNLLCKQRLCLTGIHKMYTDHLLKWTAIYT